MADESLIWKKKKEKLRIDSTLSLTIIMS